MLTKTAEYALRALLALARRGYAQPLSAATLAEMTGAPTNYLSKTLVALTRAGLVHSARGRSGGFVLANSPDSISIAQVADVFAEPRSARHCLLGNGLCNADDPCHAHRRWIRLTNASRAPLATTTLADLLRDPTDSEATESLPAEMAGIS